MRLNEDIDFTTLTWVKPELDETLRQARQALEAYVEEGEDPAQLKACATFLHQVQGTLRMVELYGAAMVAEEMEHLAKALNEGKVADRDVGYAALMRGIVQLPDYLERLQSGHRDIPIVLLPLLNELREPRGEKGLSESVLFAPDLSRPLPRSADGPAQPLAPEELKRRAETLRSLFQSALLRWLKDDDSAATIRDLTDVCEQLVPITDAEHARRLFWVAAGTLDALAKGAFEASKPLKQALAKVEREIKRLAEGGDAAFRSDPPLELTRQLLYFVAHAPTDNGRIGEIRRVFGLGDYLPSESELAHARGSLSGRNRALLATVAAAIKEDLLRVKDALDLHLRTPESAAGSLGDQVEALDRVGDTLGMLGLGMPRRVVQEQRNAIHAIVSGQRPADEAALLDIAGALLYVEASLDDQVNRLGEADTEGAAAAEPSLPGSEARKVLEVLVKEAIANFAQARQCFVAFVETHWDHAQLADVPRLLEEVSGALRILELQDAPAYLAGVRRFTENELLRRHRVPNGQQMDRLADVLASLEYYLEALRDRRPKREQILDVARQNLESLGYWPLPKEEPLPAAPVAPVAAAAPVVAPPPAASAPAPADEGGTDTGGAPVAAAAEPAAVDFPGPSFDFGLPDDIAASLAALPGDAASPPPAAEPVAGTVAGLDAPVFDAPVADAPAVDAPAPAAAAEPSAPIAPIAPIAAPSFAGPPVVPGFDGGSDEIDDEIREVFLEEFQEEIGNLEQLLPAWRKQPDNLEQLRPIRRVFHTLKGSGRLVGAKALGEFSWKVEGMLNRVLDGTRPASPAVVGLIEHAFNALPLLRAALQGETVHADLSGIEQLADRIAAGEDAFYIPPSAAPAELAASPAAPVAAPAPAPEPVPSVDIEAEPAAAAALPTEGESALAIDPVLFEILKPEVAGHLETLDAWLAQAATSPQPVTDPLLRAVHTMNGAFAMTEVTMLTDLTAPLEGYMKRALAAQRLPSAEGVSAVADAVAAIREVMASLEGPRPRLAGYPELAARIIALRDGLPEPSVPFQHAPQGASITEETPLPTAVVLEEPDLSGLPSFEAAPEHVAAEPAPDVPETEHLSLDAFLATTADEVPGFTITEAEAPGLGADEIAAAEAALAAAAAEAEAAAAAAEAAAAEAAAAEAAAAEAAAAEAAAAEAAAAEAAAAEAAAAEAAAAEAAAAEAAAAEAAAAEAAAAEAAAAEAAAAEAAAAAAEAAAAEAAAAEAAAAEAAAAEAAAAEAAAAEAAAAEAAAAEAAAAAAATDAAATSDLDDTYGMTLEELEALTAPAGEAPAVVEAEAGAIEAEAEAEALPVEALAAAGAAAVPLAHDPEDPDASLDTSELDEDLLDIFLEESGDLLDHSDGLLAGLRDNPGDREAVVGLQRDLHTLKGGARMAGIFAVGELGHAMESLLEAVAEGRRELDATGVVVLERAFDRLHGMVTRVGERKAIALPANLIGQIDALAKGRPLAAGDAVPADAAPAAPSSKVETALDRKAAAAEEAVPVVRAPATPAGAGLAPLSAPIEGLGEDEDAGGVRAPQEQVRIRADLLDRLVNYAGEVAIYRARLEQQLGAFRSNLGELGATTTRLREQLRKLDIETEAQIIARYQREGEQGGEEFDPLELDRFTTQQQLSRSLAESANDLASLQGSLDDLVRQYETLLLQQSRVSSDLQEGLMRTRMVPFDALVPRLRRVLRQSGSETGKQVNLKVDGASGEMDRNVLDRMTAPLEHMLRNAVAHGLEEPAARKKAGKPEEGTVRIQVLREGSEVVLRVSDDGKGLDKEAIRRKAIERGLLKADAEVPDQALYGFILETGFSTAQTVSRLAGRGVGMDVVYSEIRQLGGSLSIDSAQGKGTTFTVRLPFTLAVTQAVFVKIGDTSFAVPIASVQGVGRIGRAELDNQLASEHPAFMYAGEAYAIHDLGRLIGHAQAKAQDSLQMPLLLARSGDLRAAICVDQVLGSREIVVKPVGPQVNSIPGIFGATIMGDGRVVVILDVAPLVRRQATLARDAEVVAAAPVVAHRVPVVMVVDDSITMRKVTGRVLERHNFEVLTAKDGVDAIEKMAERVPDLMLLDIEMPRMDGYELAQNMKSDPRLKDVPIIMITSRTGEKHRQRAFDIGVNRYLGKPYQEVELMRNVFEMLGMEPVNG